MPTGTAIHRATPAVLTFDTHPDTLVKGVEVPLINSAEDRSAIIRDRFGIDSVIFIHFNENMMRMPWQSFADSLRLELGACHLVVGYDFSFGWKGEGRPARLAAYCTRYGMGCDIISAVCRGGEAVSSTRIRGLLARQSWQIACTAMPSAMFTCRISALPPQCGQGSRMACSMATSPGKTYGPEGP